MGREIPHRLGEDYVEFIADYFQSFFPKGHQYWHLLATSYRANIIILDNNGKEISFDLHFGIRLQSASMDPQNLYVEAKGTYDQSKVDNYFKTFLSNLSKFDDFIKNNLITHGSKNRRKSNNKFCFVSPLLPNNLDIRDLTISTGLQKIFDDYNIEISHDLLELLTGNIFVINLPYEFGVLFEMGV